MPSHLSHRDEIDKFVIEVNFLMTKRPLSSNKQSSVTKYLRHSWWPDPSLKAMPRGMAMPAADMACGDTLAGDVAPPWMLTWHHHGCWRGTTLFSHMSHFYWATCLFFYYIGKCIAFHYYTTCHFFFITEGIAKTSPKAMQIRHRSHNQFITNFVKSLISIDLRFQHLQYITMSYKSTTSHNYDHHT